MPVRVHLDPSTTVALVMLEGVIRWTHVAGALLGLYDRSDSDPDLAVLWDAQRVTDLELTAEDVPALRALMARLRPALDGGRTAIVVRRECDTDLARLLTQARPSCRREYNVFFRSAEALSFLGRPSAIALPEALRSDRVLAVG